MRPRPRGTSPSKKRDALSAVRTPDETVWSLRASDIYQGGENEPRKLTEICLAALPVAGQRQLEKLPSGRCAERTRISQNANSAMTVLFAAPQKMRRSLPAFPTYPIICACPLILLRKYDGGNGSLSDCELCPRLRVIENSLRDALIAHEIWLQKDDPNIKNKSWKCPEPI